jgi:2-(1,2-epoxy-1,2-dihydrophenyl)acetyl-CoA isomerase
MKPGLPARLNSNWCSMHESPAVTCAVEDRVARLCLNRPELNNTLTMEVLDALISHAAIIAANPSIRAVLLCAEGENFSLGGDFADFAEALACDEVHGRAYCASRTLALSNAIAGLHAIPVPLIAAVNGQAAGAGFSLALACDLRIIEQRTRFHFAYGSLGASTDGGMSWLLPRIIGRGYASRLLLEQPIIRAQQALGLGLASEIVSTSELRSRSFAVARQLAGNSAHANRAAKRLLRVSEFTSLRDHMQAEHEAFADGLMAGDMRDALAARERGETPAFV